MQVTKTYSASMEQKRPSLCSQKPQQWTLPNKLNQLLFHIISVKASLIYSNHVYDLHYNSYSVDEFFVCIHDL